MFRENVLFSICMFDYAILVTNATLKRCNKCSRERSISIQNEKQEKLDCITSSASRV